MKFLNEKIFIIIMVKDLEEKMEEQLIIMIIIVNWLRLEVLIILKIILKEI
jgi:hypothetical protein